MSKDISQNIEFRLAKVREKIASEKNQQSGIETSLPSDLHLEVGGWDNWGDFSDWGNTWW